MNKIAIIIPFLLYSFLLSAQDNDQGKNHPERMLVHLDRQEHVSGEDIWFKIYCLQKDGYSSLSKLAFIELIDPQGYSAVRKKVLLSEGRGHGHLSIPDSLTGGMYQLLGYTNWMRNFGEGQFFKDTILVFNPEKSFPENTEKWTEQLITEQVDSQDTTVERSNQTPKKASPSLYSNRLSGNPFIRMEGLKKRYTPGSKINLTLSSQPGDSLKSVSMSVHKVANPSSKQQMLALQKESTNSNQQPPSGQGYQIKGQTIQYCPEQKGIILRGKIVHQDDQPYRNGAVHLSFVDSITRIQVRKTNKNGEFRFFLYPDQFQKDLVISPGDSHTKLIVRLEDKFMNQYNFRSHIGYDLLQENYLNYLKDLYLNHRIQKHYQQESISTDSTLFKPNWTQYNFYENPGAVLEFDEYILLDSLREYFYELAPGVKIITRKKESFLQVVNQSTGQFMNGSPALFVDGVICLDKEHFFSIPPRQCEYIEIVQKPMLLHDKIHYGIISLYTKNKDLQGFELTNNASRIEYTLFEPASDFIHQMPEADHIPWFRNTLYWNPNLQLYPEDKKSITFSSGYGNAWYALEMMGIDKNGNPVRSTNYFKVGDPKDVSIR